MKTKLLKKLRSKIYSVSYYNQMDDVDVQFYRHDGCGKDSIVLEGRLNRTNDLMCLINLCLGSSMGFKVAFVHNRTLSKRAKKRAEKEKKELGKITYNFWRYGR